MQMTPKTKEILDSIGRDRTGLLESVKGLDNEQMDYHPAADAWSIGDVLHHLALAHEATAKLMAIMVQRAKDQAIPSDPEPSRSVLGSIDTIVAPAEGAKASAPDRVTPKSYLAPDEGLARLEASRARLVDTVASLSNFDLSQLTFPHPFFGELDACQWLLVTGWHERRHTAQIARIRANEGFPGR